MLRTYIPLSNHPIFTLHKYVQHLVCEVWCKANDTPCEGLLDSDFEKIYNAYDWLKTDIDSIYKKCKSLTEDQRTSIRNAFEINNRISDLCNGTKPVELSSLPKIVKEDMKPLLVKFYNELLDLEKVPGSKLDYYNKLLTINSFKTCPCCGLSSMESVESKYREDNDHYLPKSEFPFASVNFQNLVPLCSKCNKKCKGTKNPLKDGRVSYFPFDESRSDIIVSIVIQTNFNTNYLKISKDEVAVSFSGNSSKNETWNYLFEIEERYTEEVTSFSFTELRIIANRILRNSERNNGLSYEEIIEDKVDEYSVDPYASKNFLKKSFLEAMKTKPEWIAAYI
jgi:hypothetical protein